MGVGVSDDNQRAVIHLMLRYKKDVKKVPKTFEGYDVRTVVTGEIVPA